MCEHDHDRIEDQDELFALRTHLDAMDTMLGKFKEFLSESMTTDAPEYSMWLQTVDAMRGILKTLEQRLEEMTTAEAEPFNEG